MEKLSIEQMEVVQGGSCLSASIMLGASYVGTFFGPITVVTAVVGIAGIIAYSIEVENAC